MNSYFEFHNPVKICAGSDALGNLMYEAETLGMRHPLLLTDETLVRLGVARQFMEITGLKDCFLYDKVPADSKRNALFPRRPAEPAPHVSPAAPRRR